MLEAEHGVLLFLRQDCAVCRAYERDVVERLNGGELPGVVVRKAYIKAAADGEGDARHPWNTASDQFPYTLLFLNGEVVDGFPTAGGAFLLERMERALVAVPW